MALEHISGNRTMTAIQEAEVPHMEHERPHAQPSVRKQASTHLGKAQLPQPGAARRQELAERAHAFLQTHPREAQLRQRPERRRSARLWLCWKVLASLVVFSCG
jgi:hypothetical protein